MSPSGAIRSRKGGVAPCRNVNNRPANIGHHWRSSSRMDSGRGILARRNTARSHSRSRHRSKTQPQRQRYRDPTIRQRLRHQDRNLRRHASHRRRHASRLYRHASRLYRHASRLYRQPPPPCPPPCPPLHWAEAGKDASAVASVSVENKSTLCIVHPSVVKRRHWASLCAPRGVHSRRSEARASAPSRNAHLLAMMRRPKLIFAPV